MSQFLKNILSTRFTKYFGGGSTKHRCQAPNPSTAILHGPLPSPEQLYEFEQNYTGPNTPELMERYSGWSSGAIKRNKTCLVCLKSTRKPHDRSYIICNTCPRTIHFDCIDQNAPHTWHKQTCPACVKRRWHVTRPITPVQRPDQSDDDYYMQRVRRYHRWHRYNCQHIESWQRLHDDGSLESDRQLLIEMGVVKQRSRVLYKGNGTQEGRSVDDEDQPEGAQGGELNAQQSQLLPKQAESGPTGEAAEYFDPNASRLGTNVGSVRSNHSHHSAASRQTGDNRAGSVLSNAPNTTHRTSQSASQKSSPSQAPSTGPRSLRSGSQKPVSIESHKSDSTVQTMGVSKQAEQPVAPSVQSHPIGTGNISVAITSDAEQETLATPHSRAASINSQASRKSPQAAPIEDARPRTSREESKHEDVKSNVSHHSNRSKNRAESLRSKASTHSKASAMPTDSMRSYNSNASGSNISRRSERTVLAGTEISRASSGSTFSTNLHLDHASCTNERPA